LGIWGEFINNFIDATNPTGCACVNYYLVDSWLLGYNNNRAHSGKYCYGKTPMQTFLDYKHIAIEKSNESLYNNNISDSRYLNDTQI
jgi:hypothetical protein